MANCCGDTLYKTDRPPEERWRLALWLALAINAGMFAVEGGAGLLSGSASLQADALDFLGDAANYGISLGVVGLVLVWRARAALVKGATMLVFGGWVAGVTLWGVWLGETPTAEVMGIIGLAALIANVVTAVMLFGFRKGDANMRSVWICSRNDAIGNLAVMLAAWGVFGTGTRWPDLLVAAVMAGLALQGGWQVIRHAGAELKTVPAVPAPRPFKVETRHKPIA
ncbi:cation transporter [Brevundimonas faecalis]|uniref:Co/Zn/Cd efflux system component n=1 Tax=Brevundimonas faecalis TaxID=947378 RepID=A0ABV2RAF9_9CAUL